MNRKMKLSLGQKISCSVLLLSVILVIVAIMISVFTYANAMDEHYRKLAKKLAKTAAAQLDADKLDGYLETLQKDDDYERMQEELFKIKDNNDIKYLSVIKVTADSVYYIFDADRSDTKCELGHRNDILEEFLPYVGHLEQGIPTTISKGTFGWLCTAYEPIWNRKGEVVALVGVDISMNAVVADRIRFFILMIVSMGFVVVVFTVSVLVLTKRYIINPINKLVLATSEFVIGKKKGSIGEIVGIGNLDIHTGDEIEKLSNSIMSMEKDLLAYIDNLTKVTAEKERIAAELKLAATIQSGMLPYIFKALPRRDEYDIYASINPAKELGGDFYDIFLINEEKLGFVIADVSGKGVSAALFMVIAKILIKNQAYFTESPGEVFNVVNKQLWESNEAGILVTSFMGILDLRTGNLEYANAGHKIPLICKRGENYQYINSKPGFVLAGMDGMVYKSYQLQIEPGDRLFLYTDGLIDVINQAKTPYGDRRLFDILNQEKTVGLSLYELNEYISSDIKKYSQEKEQTDDITMLLLEFKDYLHK